MKRIIWKENDIINIKLNDKLYTLGQMLTDPYMLFFNISNTDGQWNSDIDLNQVPNLFCVLIGRDFLKQRAVEKLTGKINPMLDQSRLPKYWIRPNISYSGGYPFKGGALVEVDPKVGYVNGKVIIPNLSLSDIESIKKYELVNMWGSDDLTERISLALLKGIHQDTLKEKIFPEIFSI